jgi:hypothetical protein
MVKIVLLIACILLFILDFIRITHAEAARHELFSLPALALFMILFFRLCKPESLLSARAAGAAGLALLEGCLHFSVTAWNYWYVYNRKELFILFKVTGYAGICLILGINVVLVFAGG